MKSQLLTTIAAVVLVGCGPPPKDIWEAANQGDVEAVKQFIASGTDVDAKDDNGSTPLHSAAVDGSKGSAADGLVGELLIAKGADVNAQSDNGNTPLDMAIGTWDGYVATEIADFLRKHGGKTGEELKAEGKQLAG